jgi:iron complex outermembrane receptor protein
LNKNVTAFSATAGDDWDSVLIMNRPCNVLNGGCTRDFNDAQSYSNTSSKVGAKYTIDSDRMAYFSRAVGFRSGAYNLRNTNSNVLSHPPGPTLVEEVTTYEVGYKMSFEGGKATFAIFDTEIEDMQRELNEADAATGAVNQYVTNVGDAEVQGIEIDSVISLTDDLVLSLSAGYIDASYAAVTKDISGDGTVATGPIVDAKDLALELPRAAPLTWSIGLNRFGSYEGWTTNSRISLAHRDKSFFTDNNKGFINKQNVLNAGLDFTSPDGSMSIGIYGNNLTGEVRHGGDTQLSIGSYAPLMKGRVIGLEGTYNF